MSSILHPGANVEDPDGGLREVAEIDKLLSSARLNNNQHVKALSAEEQRTTAAQKQISDKQADIKCLEESTSRCDVLAKELHQRLRRARDNYESSKRTSMLLDEHIAAVQRKLQDATELRTRKSSEKKEKVQHYQEIWERYQTMYGKRPLAQQLVIAQDAAKDDVLKADSIEMEITNLQESLSRLTLILSQKEERERLKEESQNLNIDKYIIDIARARTKSAEQEQLCQRTKERIDVTQIECLKLEEKIRTMAVDIHQLDVDNDNQPMAALHALDADQLPDCIQASPLPCFTGALPAAASLQAAFAGDALLTASLGTNSSGTEPLGHTVEQSMQLSPPVGSIAATMPRGANLPCTAQNMSRNGSMQSAGQEQVPGTTPIDQGTCTPMDVAHEADVNVAHSMPPPSPHASAPTTPKTPQGMSTPRSVLHQDANVFSPGLGLQKPVSPLDSFQYSGRPMFSNASSGAQLASPSQSPGRGMTSLQTWSSQRSKETTGPVSALQNEAVGNECISGSDPASGFLAIAASLAPTSANLPEQHTQSQNFFGGTSEENVPACSDADNTAPFSMFGTSSAMSNDSTDSGFSFAFGEDNARSSTPNESGPFSFSFGGGNSPAPSSQASSRFSFGNDSDPASTSGFSFGGGGTHSTQESSTQESNSGFSFSFGASSPQQSSSSSSTFSLF